MRYTEARTSREIVALFEPTAKDACHVLGCSLPDKIVPVVPAENGEIEGPYGAAHGWHYHDVGIFIVVERPANEICRTIYHECSHHADWLKYAGDLAAALEDHEAGELRAREFATKQVRDLPAAPSLLLRALEQRLHAQKYPVSHALAMVTARGELARKELDEFVLYGEPN
jgi:hypothetical protein